MSNKQVKDQEKLPSESSPLDPYTGEPEPLAEDADMIVQVMPVDAGKRKDKDYLLNEEDAMDLIAADDNADAISQRSARYIQDKDIQQDFTDRQDLASGGRQALETELEEYHAQSPVTSGGDLDADWQDTWELNPESTDE